MSFKSIFNNIIDIIKVDPDLDEKGKKLMEQINHDIQTSMETTENLIKDLGVFGNTSLLFSEGELWIHVRPSEKCYNFKDFTKTRPRPGDVSAWSISHSGAIRLNQPEQEVIYSVARHLAVCKEGVLEKLSPEHHPLVEEIAAAYETFSDFTISSYYIATTENYLQAYELGVPLTFTTSRFFYNWMRGEGGWITRETYDEVERICNEERRKVEFLNTTYRNGMEYRQSITHDKSECVIVKGEDILTVGGMQLGGYVVIVDRHGPLWRERGLPAPDLFYAGDRLIDGVLRKEHTCIDIADIRPMTEEEIVSKAVELVGEDGIQYDYIVEQFSMLHKPSE